MTKEEKVIKEIIARYGATLDLKKTPFVIGEIIRQFGPRLGGGIRTECAPPGGPPRVLDPSEIIKELKVKAADMTRLSASLQKAISSRAKR